MSNSGYGPVRPKGDDANDFDTIDAVFLGSDVLHAYDAVMTIQRARVAAAVVGLALVGTGLTSCSSSSFCSDVKQLGQDVTALQQANGDPAQTVKVLKKLYKEAPGSAKGDFKQLYKTLNDLQNGKADPADLSKLRSSAANAQKSINSHCKLSIPLPS